VNQVHGDAVYGSTIFIKMDRRIHDLRLRFKSRMGILRSNGGRWIKGDVSDLIKQRRVLRSNPSHRN
jgi:hypothetical protein